MANAVEEVEEMVEQAQALVLNRHFDTGAGGEQCFGGQAGNALQIPIVLDPVGVGPQKCVLTLPNACLLNLN